jgi:hypothetical protein
MKEVFRSHKIVYIMTLVTYGVWEIMKILSLNGTSGAHPQGGCWAAAPPPTLWEIEIKKNSCCGKS